MIKGDPVDVNIPVIKSNKLTESEILRSEQCNLIVRKNNYRYMKKQRNR